MNKLIRSAAKTGKKHGYVIALFAVMTLGPGLQMANATPNDAPDGKPVVRALSKTVHYGKKHRLNRANRKPATEMTSVTRMRVEAYAAFIRPQRVVVPAAVRVSYSVGDAGPLLGRSPWICGPSGFGQQSSCRPRY